MYIQNVSMYIPGSSFYRSLREESEGRLPLRDAVEKRPISVLDEDTYTDLQYKYKSVDVRKLLYYYNPS